MNKYFFAETFDAPRLEGLLAEAAAAGSWKPRRRDVLPVSGGVRVELVRAKSGEEVPVIVAPGVAGFEWAEASEKAALRLRKALVERIEVAARSRAEPEPPPESPWPGKPLPGLAAGQPADVASLLARDLGDAFPQAYVKEASRALAKAIDAGAREEGGVLVPGLAEFRVIKTKAKSPRDAIDPFTGKRTVTTGRRAGLYRAVLPRLDAGAAISVKPLLPALKGVGGKGAPRDPGPFAEAFASAIRDALITQPVVALPGVEEMVVVREGSSFPENSFHRHLALQIRHDHPFGAILAKRLAALELDDLADDEIHPWARAALEAVPLDDATLASVRSFEDFKDEDGKDFADVIGRLSGEQYPMPVSGFQQLRRLPNLERFVWQYPPVPFDAVTLLSLPRLSHVEILMEDEAWSEITRETTPVTNAKVIAALVEAGFRKGKGSQEHVAVLTRKRS